MQASVDFLPAGGKLYVDYCYATASEAPWSTPSHMVVGNFGYVCVPVSACDISS